MYACEVHNLLHTNLNDGNGGGQSDGANRHFSW